jgi:filamentous hemagglutinin
MSDAEAETTLTTQSLQPPAPGANSSKYLSESLDKVAAFQNNAVSSATSESVLEFVLDKPGYQDLMSTAVNQAGSKGIDAVKINFEGISDPSLRNIGVPLSKLDAFNDLILQINKVGP